MPFLSLHFLLFAALLCLAYWRCSKASAQNFLLLGGSLYVLAVWSLQALVVVVVSTLAEWLIARAIDCRKVRNGEWSERLRRQGSLATTHGRSIIPARIATPFGKVLRLTLGRHRTFTPEQRALLFLSLGLNLGQFFLFRHLHFLVPELKHALGLAPASAAWLNFAIPVGISFWTLQKMTLTLDVWLGRTSAERSFPKTLTFVAFFPNLVSGPIERGRHFLPQLASLRRWDSRRFSEGIWLIAIGIFQKIVIADNVADCADALLQPGASSLSVLLGLWAYALQIYADFAGYSDMARGVARLFGIDLFQNFDAPYLASNLSDFWKRWHASLTSWLNDYIFNPLSMAWRDWGTTSILLATFATFLASGLWHGTGWTYMVWASVHAIGLSILVLTKDRRKTWKKRWGKTRWYDPAMTILTFHWVCLGYLFFRAPSLQEAFGHMASLVHGDWFRLPSFDPHVMILCALPIFALQYQIKKSRSPFWIFEKSVTFRTVFYILLGVAILRLYSPAEKFIYFQF